MDLQAYLSKRLELVNSALDELLPAEDEFPTTLNRAVRYSVFAGGKRIRPVLVLGACEAVGGSIADALNTACALECIHTYSLIHDDLPALDNDDLRRSRPTCHKAFNEATAILAGDALLTTAFELITMGPLEDKPRIVSSVVREVARGAGTYGMIGGQVLDLESEGADISLPLVQQIHSHKTGSLIAAAVRAGAIIGMGGTGEGLDIDLDLDIDEEKLSALTRYGKAIGLAFQVFDDILDVEGTSLVTGKPTGGDALKKKATYPALVGLKGAKEMATELTRDARESLKDFGEEAEPLRAIASYIVERDK